MRVMVLVKANEQSERGEMPSEKLLSDMTAYNEELVKAGVMLAGEGLFAETKELLAGFWIWQVTSLDEAVEWVKRMPAPDEGEEAVVEIRPVFDAEDFGEQFTPELREREAAMRAQVEGTS
jgi:hypothetical protein